MMDTTHLIRMANQIGTFFEALPVPEEGVAGVAEHLRKFWEPRMLTGLLAHVAEHGDSDLKPVVGQALKVISADPKD